MILDKNQLIKEKRELWYTAKDLKKKVENEKRLLSQEEITLYQSWVDRMHEIQSNIDTLQSMEDMATENRGQVFDTKGTVIGDKEEQADKYNRAVNNWIRFGMTGISEEERKLIQPNASDGGKKQSIELRAIGTLAGTSYTQATDVMAAVATAKKFYGNFFPAFDEFTTAKGNPLTWPKLDDTSYAGALEAAGTDAFDSSNAVTLTSSTLNNYIYSSQGVGVANDALEDADFPIDRILGEALGTRLWRKIALDCTTGTGTTMISGIVGKGAGIGCPIGVGAGNGTITRARILQLMGKVDYAYHLAAGCGFMMHSSMMYELAGVGTASTDGRPLWQPSMVAGVPDKIEGFPYWINNNLSANTDVAHSTRLGKRHILFGDFKQYKLRYIGPATLIRLNELYAAQLQTGFILLQRADGKLLMPNTGTYAPVKYLRKYPT
jgi:HK97 family phage major capsid protein